MQVGKTWIARSLGPKAVGQKCLLSTNSTTNGVTFLLLMTQVQGCFAVTILVLRLNL